MVMAVWKMCMHKVRYGFAMFLLASAVSLAQADDLFIGLGMPLTQEEIDRYSLTIFPDGRNLPAGQGTAMEGEMLYQTRCAMCHGETGKEGPASRLRGSDGFFSWSDPLRILRIDKYPLQVLSVGAQWPYATTLFDYIRRAMPHFAPKSLTDDEVYAVTAYVLYVNDLIEQNQKMDAQSLPTVAMPGLSRTAP